MRVYVHVFVEETKVFSDTPCLRSAGAGFLVKKWRANLCNISFLAKQNLRSPAHHDHNVSLKRRFGHVFPRPESVIERNHETGHHVV